MNHSACLVLGLALSGLASAQEVKSPPPPPPQVTPRLVTMSFVGDTMPGSVYPSRAALPPDDGKRVFERVKHLWLGSQVVFGNFEGAIASNASSARALGSHSYRFLMPPETLAIYKEAGFNALNVANNHAMDAGASGREATLRAMDEAGMTHFGSTDRPAAVVTTPQGVKVGLIGSAPHMSCFPLDVEQVGQQVKALKADGCSLVIVSMHAGAEGKQALHVPKAKEVYLGADRGDVYAFAHGVVDAGADLVIGHGPHVVRGMEVYKGHLIAYSLGNFATYGAFNIKGTGGQGLVLTVVLAEDGTLKGLRILSTKQDKDSEAWQLGISTESDPEEGARKLVEKLSMEDFKTDLPAHYLP